MLNIYERTQLRQSQPTKTSGSGDSPTQPAKSHARPGIQMGGPFCPTGNGIAERDLLVLNVALHQEEHARFKIRPYASISIRCKARLRSMSDGASTRVTLR